MSGINTDVAGGIYRASNNMDRVNSLLQKSLERLETGNKVNRASDNPTVFGKALSVTADINAISTQLDVNRSTLADLDKVDVAQTRIIESYQSMKEAADALAAAYTSGDVAAQTAHTATITDLQKAINAFATEATYGGNAVLDTADATENLQFGVDATDVVAHQWRDLSTDAVITGAQVATITADITALADAATATALSTDIDAVLGNAMAASSSMAVTKKNVFEAAQSSLTAELSTLSDLRSSLMSVNEAEESSIITNLQMRQQAMVTSMGIQNTFTASTLDLLG